jgi:hypothetical protein
MTILGPGSKAKGLRLEYFAMFSKSLKNKWKKYDTFKHDSDCCMYLESDVARC